MKKEKTFIHVMLDKELIKLFKKKCVDLDITMTRALTELILDFLKK